jgi:chromosome partitioning protein
MRFENAFDFEKHIKILFEKKYKNTKVELAEANTKGFDLKMKQNSKNFAIQVKNHKAKIHAGFIQKFLDFLEFDKKKMKSFNGGIFVSSSGYYDTVVTLLQSSEIKNVILYTYSNGELKLFWKYGIKKDEKELIKPKKESKKYYVGVFTAKGGVGKTTISAHLAGAFAMNGFEVVLIDMDTQSNLRTLLGEGVYVPPINSEVGTNITVIDAKEWDEDNYKDIEVVICDCNPELANNPKNLIEKFDYCIIPTTLNPLGINKNANVIERTFKELRYMNESAKLFVLINNFIPKERVRNEKLNELLKSKFSDLQKADENFFYIDPLSENGVSIRHSSQLLYWGYHIIDGAEPQLGFEYKGGRSYPRDDFLVLANYLLEHTEIEHLNKK